jgi:hypothetical protein
MSDPLLIAIAYVVVAAAAVAVVWACWRGPW